jgi:murein DD-endopeptidase MepM/ murein hydrolase activator NlpD
MEPIARIASAKVLLSSCLVLFSLFSFLGSSAHQAVPVGTALGSVDVSRLELDPGLDGDGRDDAGLYYTAYRVERGDTLSGIASAHDVSLDTVISFNDITNARSLQPGRILKIPNMSGILYSASAGDTAVSVAASNSVSADRIVEANGLMKLGFEAGRKVFLPDARMASFKLREISGDVFRWPASAWITSWYGWRNDPFTGQRRFHNGLDIGVDSGTPVLAPMEGTVAETGYSSGSGNYVYLVHHSGWSSLFGHLQTISVTRGQRVVVGTRLGFSGNTGYSTGPHLHFSVFKNGRSANPANFLH